MWKAPIHFKDRGYARAVCLLRVRPEVRITRDESEVTCDICLKKLARRRALRRPVAEEGDQQIAI